MLRAATVNEEWSEVLGILRETGHDLEREHHDAGHPGQAWMTDRAIEYFDAHELGIDDLEARLARRGLRLDWSHVDPAEQDHQEESR